MLVAGVYDCLSAFLAEKAGFHALYLSGGALSVAKLGQPDIGLLTLEDVAETARAITGAVSLPLIVDVDTGFGGAKSIQKTVRTLERAGVAAIQMEDQVPRKKCGHLKGKKLISASAMQKRLKVR